MDGLTGKFNDVQILLQEVSLDIFAIIKTHLSKDIKDESIQVEGCNFVRRDQSDKSQKVKSN